MPTDPVIATIHIDAPPERVFGYLADPQAITRWMGDSAALEPHPGGQFAVDILGTAVCGHVVHIDPPHHLTLSWGYPGSGEVPPGASTVDIHLTADDTGTTVVLRHHDLPPGATAGHHSGWRHYLARLATVAAGADPGPDPGMPLPPEPVAPNH